MLLAFVVISLSAYNIITHKFCNNFGSTGSRAHARVSMCPKSAILTGVLISSWPDQEGNKLGSMSGTRAISTTSRRELSSLFF